MNPKPRRIVSAIHLLLRLSLLTFLAIGGTLTNAAGTVQPTGSVCPADSVGTYSVRGFYAGPVGAYTGSTNQAACDAMAESRVMPPNASGMVNTNKRGLVSVYAGHTYCTAVYTTERIPCNPPYSAAQCAPGDAVLDQEQITPPSQCQCNVSYEPNGPATACVVPPTEEQSCSTANPVQPGTGRKRFTETDYAGAGAHPLNLTRHYSSRWTDSAAATGLAPIAAWDGGWRHSYQASLTQRADGSLRAMRPDGTMLGFTASANVANTWTAAGSRDTVTALVQAGTRTGYTLVHKHASNET